MVPIPLYSGGSQVAAPGVPEELATSELRSLFPVTWQWVLGGRLVED